jgi:hypothetical protein
MNGDRVLGSTTVLIHGSVRTRTGATVVVGRIFGTVAFAAVTLVTVVAVEDERPADALPHADTNRPRVRISARRMSA